MLPGRHWQAKELLRGHAAISRRVFRRKLGAGAGDELEIKVPPFCGLDACRRPGPGNFARGPAPGICHHILIAGLFLQAQASSSGTQAISTSPEAIRDEIGFFTPERLKAWREPGLSGGTCFVSRRTPWPR
jgi:hypothetical protein